MTRLLLAALLAALPALADSSNTSARSVTRPASGLYVIRHPDAPDGFPQSNTVVVIGAERVLVVDSCLLPSTTRQDVEEIRRWTKLPVTYLVNTHWHFDHTLGNATYAAAWPAVQIVAHAETARKIASYNPGAVARYPQRAERFRKMLDTGKQENGEPVSPALRADLEKSIAGLQPVVDEFRTVRQRLVDLAFDQSLSLDLGGREVKLLWLGRANTAGDTIVWLPKERIALVGDTLVHPVPYLFGGFPWDLPATLDRIAALEPLVLIPGHGDTMTDLSYVRQTRDLVAEVNRAVEAAFNDGKKLPEVREAVARSVDVPRYKKLFGGSDQDSLDTFEESFEGLVKASFEQESFR